MWWRCLHYALTTFKARLNTRGTLWSARERASVALSAEQERHTKCVSRCLKQLTFIFIYFQTFTSSTSFITVQFSLSIHSFDFRSNFLFTKTNNRLTVFPAIKSRAKRGPSRISAEIKPHLETPGGQEGPPAHLRFLSNCL